MAMKSFQKCKKAYVFTILAACLFLVVSLAFSAGPVITCKHCGNNTACDEGDPNTQQGWENCIRDEDPVTGQPWCRVWGKFDDCEM